MGGIQTHYKINIDNHKWLEYYFYIYNNIMNLYMNSNMTNIIYSHSGTRYHPKDLFQLTHTVQYLCIVLHAIMLSIDRTPADKLQGRRTPRGFLIGYGWSWPLAWE